MSIITPVNTLDTIERIEFDMPFTITADGVAAERPDVYVYTDGITLAHSADGEQVIEGLPSGWVPVSGLSNQDHYAGPVMHPSEVLSETTMRHLHTQGQDNTFVMVTALDGDLGTGNLWDGCDCNPSESNECICDPFIDGWMLLRRTPTN